MNGQRSLLDALEPIDPRTLQLVLFPEQAPSRRLTHTLVCPRCGASRRVTRHAHWRSIRRPVPGRCAPCSWLDSRLLRDEKPCRTCGQTKPLEDFFRSKKQYDGRESRCKDCTRSHLAAVSAADPWRPKIASHEHYARRRHGARNKVDYRAVIARGMTCHICGDDIAFADVSFDHVIPFNRGGEHTTENVWLSHMVCNSRKGYLLVEEM